MKNYKNMTLEEIYKYRFDLLCKIRKAEEKLNKLKFDLQNNSYGIRDNICGDAIFGCSFIDAKEEYEKWIEKKVEKILKEKE